MGTKTYTFETMISSLKDGLRAFLREMGIEYSVSDGKTWHGGSMLWHFCIHATEEQVNAVNAWLDANTITAI